MAKRPNAKGKTDITLVAAYFDRPINEAAKELGAQYLEGPGVKPSDEAWRAEGLAKRKKQEITYKEHFIFTPQRNLPNSS